MNARQAHALARPLTGEEGYAELAPYRVCDVQRDGNLLMSILAVDR